MGIRHQPRLHARAARLLAHEVRLAQARGGAESLQALHDRHRWSEGSLHSRGRARPESEAAAASARMAWLDLRVHGNHSDAHRSELAWRRRTRFVHGDRALATRLWIF